MARVPATLTGSMAAQLAPAAVLGAGIAVAIDLVCRVQVVWRITPGYEYGWAIPLACVYLAWERWADRPPTAPQPVSRLDWVALALALAVLAVLRLALEPAPAWPMALWLFAAVALGLAGRLLRLSGGPAVARHFAFPLAYAAVALPWPAVVDTYLVYPLREALAWTAAEAVSWLGHPALAEGTLVTVGRGVVAVDEACSGIRSLQATLVAALFLGELHRFSIRRRLALLGAGLALALGTNLMRTVALALVSARQGIAAVSRWHDGTGYVLLVVCLGGLMLAAWLAAARSGPATSRRDNLVSQNPPRRRLAPTAALQKGGRQIGFACALVAGLVVIELGTRAWFSSGATVARTRPWTAELHTQRDFIAEPFTPAMQQMLGCDHHVLGRWRAPDGSVRHGYVLEWNRGQTARIATHLHTPAVCLPLSGRPLTARRGQVRAGALGLPFDAYAFGPDHDPLYVYHLVWDVRAGAPLPAYAGAANAVAWIRHQWSSVALRRRHVNVVVLAIGVTGVADAMSADARFRAEVDALIQRPDNPPVSAALSAH